MAQLRPSRIVDLSKEIAYNRDDPYAQLKGRNEPVLIYP
jgi:hypothetical protein